MLYFALMLIGCSGPKLGAPVAPKSITRLVATDARHFRNFPLGAWEIHVDTLGSPTTSGGVDYIAAATGGETHLGAIVLYRQKTANGQYGFQTRPLRVSERVRPYSSITMFDIDGDGSREIVAGAAFGGIHWPSSRIGDAGLYAWSTQAGTDASGTRVQPPERPIIKNRRVTAVDYLDANLDGALDLVVGLDERPRDESSEPPSTLAVYLNTCVGERLAARPTERRVPKCFDATSPSLRWTTQATSIASNAALAPQWIRVADVDLDNRMEIIAAIPDYGTLVFSAEQNGSWPPSGTLDPAMTACDAEPATRTNPCRWGSPGETGYDLDVIRTPGGVRAARTMGCVEGHGACPPSDDDASRIGLYSWPSPTPQEHATCPSQRLATAVQLNDTCVGSTFIAGCQERSEAARPAFILRGTERWRLSEKSYWTRDIETFAGAWAPTSITSDAVSLPPGGGTVSLHGAGPFRVQAVSTASAPIPPCSQRRSNNSACFTTGSRRRSVTVVSPAAATVRVTYQRAEHVGLAIADRWPTANIDLITPFRCDTNQP